jgi:hypothetical protein
MGQDAGRDDGVMRAAVAAQGRGQLRDLGRSLPLASPASAAGSRSPAISASIIARPDWVSTFEAGVCVATVQDRALGVAVPLIVR